MAFLNHVESPSFFLVLLLVLDLLLRIFGPQTTFFLKDWLVQVLTRLKITSVLTPTINLSH
jgi:hypothetical protein